MSTATDSPRRKFEDLNKLSPVMAALGSRTRQRILMLKHVNKGLAANEIADHFNLSRTAIEV